MHLKSRYPIQGSYNALIRTFQNTNSAEIDIDCTLDGVGLIGALFEEEVARKSDEFFYIVAQGPASPVCTQGKKRKAARLAFHGAYKRDRVLLPVKDRQPILDFLCHHFELVEGGKVHNEPIQNALPPLACNPAPETIEAFENFDPTQRSFVRGTCSLFQES